MGDELTFEDTGEYLTFRYSGIYGFPALSDAALAIGETCLRLGRKSVLVDIRASHGELSVPERYQIANEMAHHWERTVRLAILGRADQQLPDKPWEVVATERGLSASVFMDEARARRWLLDRSGWHLAQANVARMKFPIEHPSMDRFRAQLDAINALADASPGFVWRLQSDAGNATDIHAYEDPLILFNMSVWESLEALQAYTYKSPHAGPLRDRREWFEPSQTPSFVLWWIPAGHVPTIDEAKAKLLVLAERGPSPDAFTFRTAFPRPLAAE